MFVCECAHCGTGAQAACTLPVELWALALEGCLSRLGRREEEGCCLDLGPGLCNASTLSQLNMDMHAHAACTHTDTHVCALREVYGRDIN